MDRFRNSHLTHIILIPLVLLAIGTLAYGFSLRLPLFSDDMPHFRWLQGQSFLDILSSARDVGYYRPLPFLMWKTLWTLQGELHSPTLHALNFGLHLVNGLLIWKVVTNHGQKNGTLLGAASALLFLLYPFSYQAVPWVGSLTHPLVAAIILSSLFLYQLSKKRSSLWLKIGSLILAFLAPFAHETGILIAPLLTLLLLTRTERTSLKYLFHQTRLYWLAMLVGLTIWLIVPKGVDTPSIWNLEARYQNGAYLLQGLAYPVAPLARYVSVAGWGLDDMQSILFVCGTAVFLWTGLVWRAGGGRWLLLAGGWFTLTIAPVWLMLGFDYVVDGPRLLYTASVGAALFWSIPLALEREGRRLNRIGRIAAVIAVLAFALQGYLFLQQRADIYKQLRLMTDQFVEAVRSVATPGTVLCVNCPQFLAPRSPTFAVGHEGVPFFISHQLDDFFWVNTEKERDIQGTVLPDVQSEWTYHYGGAGPVHTRASLQEPLRQAAGVILTNYEGNDIALHPVGALQAENWSPQHPFQADFDGRVRLLSTTVEQEAETLHVILRWQSLQLLLEDTTIFVHLVDASGQLIAQQDGYPLMGLSHPLAWQPGDIWQDVRYLYGSTRSLKGEYSVNVGLYPLDGDPRLEALAPTGQRFPDDAVPVATVTFP